MSVSQTVACMARNSVRKFERGALPRGYTVQVFHKPLFVHLASEGSMFVTHLALQVRFASFQGAIRWTKHVLLCAWLHKPLMTSSCCN